VTKLLVTIARLRRAMPRNADAMVVCDELDRMLTTQSVNVAVNSGGAGVAVNKLTPVAGDEVGRTHPARRNYMREYMRKRRAAKA
jgi:hypothetical protein